MFICLARPSFDKTAAEIMYESAASPPALREGLPGERQQEFFGGQVGDDPCRREEHARAGVVPATRQPFEFGTDPTDAAKRGVTAAEKCVVRCPLLTRREEIVRDPACRPES